MNTGLHDLSVPALLRLAQDKAADTRAIYQALGEALVNGDTADLTLTDWQRSILSSLLRQIVGDIYSSLCLLIRAGMEDGRRTASIAWSALNPDHAPRVYAIMSRRGLLRDQALIEGIVNRLCQHQLEQATRPPERNRWTNTPSLENPHDFFEQPLPEYSPVYRRIAAYLIDRSRRTDRYGNPVMAPADIDPRFYERLHWRVAATLRHMLVEESDVESSLLDEMIESACTETIRLSQVQHPRLQARPMLQGHWRPRVY